MRVAFFSLSLLVQSAPLAISCSLANAMWRVTMIACVTSALTFLQSRQGGLFPVLLTGSSVDDGCPSRLGDLPLSRRWDPRSFQRNVFERAHHTSRARTLWRSIDCNILFGCPLFICFVAAGAALSVLLLLGASSSSCPWSVEDTVDTFI